MGNEKTSEERYAETLRKQEEKRKQLRGNKPNSEKGSDKLLKNKKIIIVAIVIIALAGIFTHALLNTGETTSTRGTATVVGDLKITDIYSKVSASGDPSNPTYYYGIGGTIENLSISGYDYIDDGSYVIEAKFYDSNGKILETDVIDTIHKESGKKSSFDRTSFQYCYSSKNKITIGKVEIKLLDKNGNVLASTTYQFNNDAFEDNTKVVENKPDTSSNEDTGTDSSSSSDSSSSDSSSSGGTFEQGFRDGAADAKAGRPARFSGDPIMYGDPYQAGYADGYRNPHLV